MSKETKILVIEDNLVTAGLLKKTLEREDYKVLHEIETETGYDRAKAVHPDLILLDIVFDALNGFAPPNGITICRRIRNAKDKKLAQIPIIIISGLSSEPNKIAALDAGADDYLVKPFSLAELLARIIVNLERADRQVRLSIPKELTIGDLRIVGEHVFKGEARLHLRPREFELLRTLMASPGVVLTTENLLTEIWGYDTMIDSSTVTKNINLLRSKIEDDPKNPTKIETVRGLGFRFKI